MMTYVLTEAAPIWDEKLTAGQYLILISYLFMAVSSGVVSKKKTLMIQNMQYGIVWIACILLNSLSIYFCKNRGLWGNGLAETGILENLYLFIFVRNMLLLNKGLTMNHKVLLISLMMFVSGMKGIEFYEHTGGVFLIPLCIEIAYTFLAEKWDGIQFKRLLIVMESLLLIHDILIRNFIGAVAYGIAIFAAVSAINRIKTENIESIKKISKNRNKKRKQ